MRTVGAADFAQCKLLQVADVDGVLVVRFNRPDKLNAMSTEMIDELIEVFGVIAGDPSRSAVVLTGTGRAFMAGADIEGYAGGNRQAFVDFQRHGAKGYAALRNSPVIVVAAVNGFALGGGLEMVLAADVAIGAQSARLGLPEVKLGLLPGGGGTTFLRSVLPPAVHKDLLLSGRALTADEAYLRGLLTRVVADDELEQTAISYARKLQGFSRVALREIKELLAQQGSVADLLELEHQALLRCFDSADGREGIQAFVDKREPRFNVDPA